MASPSPAHARLDEMRRKLQEMRSITGAQTSATLHTAAAETSGWGRGGGDAEIECVLAWRGFDELALTGETTADGPQKSSFRQSPRGRGAASVATLSWDAALSGDYKVWVRTVERRAVGAAATAFEATLYVAGEEPRTMHGQADPAADVLIFDFSVRREDHATAVSPPYSRLSLEVEQEVDESWHGGMVVDEDPSYLEPAGAGRVVRRVSRSPVRHSVLIGEQESLDEGEYSRRPRYSSRGRDRRESWEWRESPSPRRRASPSRRGVTRSSVSPVRVRQQDGDVVDVIAVRERERAVSPRHVASRRELSPWRHGRATIDRSSRHHSDGDTFWGRSHARLSEGLDVPACCSVDVVDGDGIVDRVPLLCGQPADASRPLGRSTSSGSQRYERSVAESRAGSRSPRRRDTDSDRRQRRSYAPAAAEGRLTETREARIQRQLDSRAEMIEDSAEDPQRKTRRAQPEAQSFFSACMSADDGGGSWWAAESEGNASTIHGRTASRSPATRRLKPPGRPKAGGEGSFFACLSPS